jgi:hypothetical protein
VLLVAGFLSLCAPISDAGSVRQAYLEGQRPWLLADYDAETTTEMWLFVPWEAIPFTLQWRVNRLSHLQRREANWVVNLRDVVEQDDLELVRRYGFGLIDQFVWYTDIDGVINAGVGSDKGRSRKWGVAARGGTAVFEGILPSSGVEVAEILQMAGTASVVHDRETVAGYRTLLVHAQKPGLSIRMWIAPDSGHQLVRLEVLLGAVPEHAALVPSPAGTGATVDHSIVRYDVIVDDVEIDTIHGHPLITRAVVTERWLYGNGAIVIYFHNASRSQIELDPAPLDGRMALDVIPEGALLYGEGPAGPVYRWRDDQLFLTIDAHLSSVVESAIGDAVKALAGGGVIDRMETGIGDPQDTFGKDPYCGIFSFYGAARLLHKAIDLRALVSPRYVSTPDGSSIQDLLDAAADHGLHAQPLKNLGTDDLLTAGCPTILHVKREAGAPQSDHFVLFCPTLDRRGVVIDLPRGVYPMQEYDLASLWNGVGVVISERPMFGLSWASRLALACATIILVMTGWRWWLRSRRSTGTKTGGAAS